MQYDDLLPQIRGYQQIVVVGPHRGGTTIAARILAHDLGRKCLVEEDYPPDDVAAFFQLLQRQPACVIQAPQLSFICEHLVRAAVVWMLRDLEEIERSQRRMSWSAGEAEERRRYHDASGVPIAEIKLNRWRQFQQPVLGHRGFELQYTSLASHALWVPTERRINFGNRQTKVT